MRRVKQCWGGEKGELLRSTDPNMKTRWMSLWLPKPPARWLFSLLLPPPPHSSCLPLAARQLPAAEGLCGAITCGSEQVFLLAYIKHLAVSSRRALKAGMCSPRGEVTIQESCFLKGFCKTMGLLGGHGGQRNGIKERVGEKK